MEIKKFVEFKNKILENCSKVIVGKDDIISSIIVCFICSGHVLLEDIPGTGKTMLLRAFSKTIGGNFKRIQFTPDLLPSDLTGINYYNSKEEKFIFRQGPLFSNIVLADEINRATPRTQSSLLEAMEEHQITVDGQTMLLDEPFMVMATQNPIESSGTFPLPEAQIDRFFMKLSLGYMTKEQEIGVMSRKSTLDIIENLECVITKDETNYLKNNFNKVLVNPDVAEYMINIVQKTRSDSRFVVGVSTRGSIALYKASQTFAAINGRDFVLPEDVKSIAKQVLCHRVVLLGGRRNRDIYELFDDLINEVPVPLEKV